MTGFIGVHVGAGYHSEKYREEYFDICKQACIKGVEVLRSGGDGLEAVCLATACLEDSHLTNAGVGSSLTWEGGVQCDASVMDSFGRYGSVGAVPAVRNPILLAKGVCLARATPLSLDRVPPCLLVGEGASKWAKDHGHCIVEPDSLISDRAKRQHLKYKTRSLSQNSKGREGMKERLDTVGAVCVDLEGRLCAAASSGGVLLKLPGRVGQAAHYGAGVWAQQLSYEVGKERGGVAVTTSGTGEQLITSLLARSVALPLLSSSSPALDLHNSLKTHFLDSPFLRGEKKKLCGVLAVKAEDDCERGELLWSHTTLTMVLGYMTTRMAKPKSLVSRLDEAKVGCEPVIGGVAW